MAVTPLGVGLTPVTEPRHVIEKAAAATVYRGSLVTFTANDTVTMRADAASTKIVGVALNYALVGEKVLICDDPAQRYAVSLVDTPANCKGHIGKYADTAGGAAASSGSAHRSAAVINTATLNATAAPTLPLQIIGVHPIVGNPYGDGTGVGSATNIVEVIINMKEFFTPWLDVATT